MAQMLERTGNKVNVQKRKGTMGIQNHESCPDGSGILEKNIIWVRIDFFDLTSLLFFFYRFL
jgi:hypothetical protein